MNIENSLLSKVIDNNSFFLLRRFNVTEDDFYTQKETFNFIQSYVDKYRETPAYTTVVAECPSFEYEAEVADQMEYLCRKIKSDRARREAFNLLQNEASAKFSDLSGDKFIAWLKESTDKIYDTTQVISGTGSNWATNGEERKKMYLDIKNNKSSVIVPTPFETLNAGLGGGFFAGDYVLLEAYTNKGKSWVASYMGIAAWCSNFGVLHYSPELSQYNQQQRLDTLFGHFNNMALRNGNLYEENEENYFNYLTAFSETNTDNAPYIVKTMEDLSGGLSVDVVEADLQENSNIKMVIIDGFSLMNHGRGAKLRDNMTVTSRRLRQLCGKYNVVLILVHQVSTQGYKDSKVISDDDFTPLNPPDLTAYSETAAVIQDACTVLTYDYSDGDGALRVVKSRANNVDQRIDLQVNYNQGYITETDNSVF